MSKEIKLKEDDKEIEEKSKRNAQLWTLAAGEDLKEITHDLLASPDVSEERKQEIIAQGRHIFLFTYPSDGLRIKATISFVGDSHRTLIYLRGGNRLFGLPSPASDISMMSDYTVLTTAYRGGISQGEDEFGGRDVQDVKALIDYIPTLERKLSLQIFSEEMFLLGSSRGAMQMFLALTRFPELQSKFSKIASLTGLLDMKATIQDRSGMKKMFIDDFGLQEGVNEEEWIQSRNPLDTVDHLRRDLPILIIQAGADSRVELHEGQHMVQRLTETGHKVTYWQFEGDDHCLANRKDRVALLLQWFN